jgi:peptide/nickel transport system permease protein
MTLATDTTASTAGREARAGLLSPLTRRAITGPLRRISVLWILVVAVVALFGRFFFGSTPNATSSAILKDPSAHHLLGTDELGRDVLARVIAGARTSIEVASIAVVVAVAFGFLIGALATLGPKWLDQIVMRLTDVVLGFPAIIMALVLSLVIGRGVLSVAFVIGWVDWPNVARLVRARLATEFKQDYVTAERSTGASSARILLWHVVRNVAAPIGAFALLLFADAMLFEAALSFLGIGIQPPTASWGNMILEGQQYLVIGDWWLGVFPGIALFVTVVSLNAVGDRWLARFDPLLQQRG